MRKAILILFATGALSLAAQAVPEGFGNAQRFVDEEVFTVEIDQLKPESSALKARKTAKVKAGRKRFYMESYRISNKLLY